MKKMAIVEMLVEVERLDDDSILEDLKQELNCATHSIDIVSYKEALPLSSWKAVPGRGGWGIAWYECPVCGWRTGHELFVCPECQTLFRPFQEKDASHEK